MLGLVTDTGDFLEPQTQPQLVLIMTTTHEVRQLNC